MKIGFIDFQGLWEGRETAFAIPWDEIEDEKLKDQLTKSGVEDALDFDIDIDTREREIIRDSGINNSTVKRLLKHRIALGLIKYPMAATYLIEHYERLQGRVFEKKKFTELGKRWYEYHRPRDPHLLIRQQNTVIRRRR